MGKGEKKYIDILTFSIWMYFVYFSAKSLFFPPKNTCLQKAVFQNHIALLEMYP